MRIVITASGIQDYIFDITQKAASTRLRGRSARLGLVLDRCHQRIAETFKGQFEVRRNAGSRLEIDVDPDLDSQVAELINKLQTELDKHSIQELDSQVWFTAVAGDPDGIYSMLSGNKLKPGQTALQTQNPETKAPIWNSGEFRFTRKADERKFQREEADLARNLSEARLGHALARKDTAFVQFIASQTEEEIRVLDQFARVTKDEPNGFRFSLEPPSFLPDRIYKPLCRYAPTDDKGHLLDLTQIAEQSTGAKFLGVFKADLDNAGAVFRERAEDPRRKLSQEVNSFFTEKLEQLIRGNYPYIYIVYSGGDDLFLLGPWDQLLKLALELQKRLAESAARWGATQLTLSAGFKLAHPSSPVRYLAAEADAALETAKASAGKNRIAVFERLLRWDEVAEAMAWAEEFRTAAAAKDGKLSVSFLQRLQYFAGESRRYFEGHELDALSMIPLLQNAWTRNRDKVEPVLQQKFEANILPLLKQLNDKGERMWRIVDFASRFACYALR